MRFGIITKIFKYLLILLLFACNGKKSIHKGEYCFMQQQEFDCKLFNRVK